jgi:hypothetical protein
MTISISFIIILFFSPFKRLDIVLFGSLPIKKDFVFLVNKGVTFVKLFKSDFYGFSQAVPFLGNVNFKSCLLSSQIFLINKRNIFEFFQFLRLVLLISGGNKYYDFIIRGKGYRFRFFQQNSNIWLLVKFGYSHRILFPLLSESLLSFGSNKRYDFFLANQKFSYLGTYVNEIRRLNVADVYKAKGIRFYYSRLLLKAGKVR